jgi:hypothetical protein
MIPGDPPHAGACLSGSIPVTFTTGCRPRPLADPWSQGRLARPSPGRAGKSGDLGSDHRPVAGRPRRLRRRRGADPQASAGSQPRRDRPLRARAGVHVGLARRARLGLPPAGGIQRGTGRADVRGARWQARTPVRARCLPGYRPVRRRGGMDLPPGFRADHRRVAARPRLIRLEGGSRHIRARRRPAARHGRQRTWSCTSGGCRRSAAGHRRADPGRDHLGQGLRLRRGRHGLRRRRPSHAHRPRAEDEGAGPGDRP